MSRLKYYCSGCGNQLKVELSVPAAPRSVMATIRCDNCKFMTFLYASNCPECNETNFAITSIEINNTELQILCQRCHRRFYWCTP